MTAVRSVIAEYQQVSFGHAFDQNLCRLTDLDRRSRSDARRTARFRYVIWRAHGPFSGLRWMRGLGEVTPDGFREFFDGTERERKADGDAPVGSRQRGGAENVLAERHLHCQELEEENTTKGEMEAAVPERGPVEDALLLVADVEGVDYLHEHECGEGGDVSARSVP